MLDVDGTLPKPPYPAYHTGKLPDVQFVAADEVCPACQDAIEATYHRVAP